MKTRLSDHVMRLNRLIVGAAIVYAGAVSFSHASEYQVRIECPHKARQVAACNDRGECLDIGAELFDQLSNKQRRTCEINVSKI